MKRIHVKGNTWVLEGPQLVGLYQIDESTCLLLDPGSTKLQGEIEAALAQAGIELFPGVSGDALAAVAQLAAGTLAFDPNTTCDHHHEEGHTCGEHDHNCGGFCGK